MNTCDTCKWWGLNPDLVTPRLFSFGFKSCGKISGGTWDGSQAAGSNIEFEAMDAPVTVATGGKFGCIKHEPSTK